MHEIHFYEDKDGISPVYNYIESLSKRTDKDSRINHNKINDYIEILSQYGTVVGEPYLKHLEDDIWELRPIRCRILLRNGQTIVLSCFTIFNSRKHKRHQNEILTKRNGI